MNSGRTAVGPLRRASRRTPAPPSGEIELRSGRVADAEAIYALITDHLAEGHLLPRDVSELRLHADRFVVADRDGTVVGCGELAPLSRGVAEIRSLVVERDARGGGVAGRIVGELQRRARVDGFRKLCAFSHQPRFFIRMGFSIVPHQWLPEKIMTDCHTCALFRQCGQYAVVLPLAAAQGSFVPLASLGERL